MWRKLEVNKLLQDLHKYTQQIMHFANILYSYYVKTFAKNTVIMQQRTTYLLHITSISHVCVRVFISAVVNLLVKELDTVGILVDRIVFCI